MHHIQNTLDSIPYDANLGIVTFNHSMTYYAIPDDLSNENVKRISCVDFESPFCALSQGELYINVAKSREKLDFLINHLTEAAKNFDTSKAANINLDILFESIAESMQHTGGKVLIFGCTLPNLGKSATAIIDTDDGKSDKTRFAIKVSQVKQNQYIEEKAAVFNEYRICVDQFWFHKPGFPVSTFGHISQRTGGKFYYYADYNEFT